MFKVCTVYPPPDEDLRNWLLDLNKLKNHDDSDITQEFVAKLLHGFIRSLLLVTLNRLEAIEGSATLNS